MDASVEASFRALVRGLKAGGALDEAQVTAVVAALEGAAADQLLRKQSLHEGEILRLSRGIAKDAGLASG